MNTQDQPTTSQVPATVSRRDFLAATGLGVAALSGAGSSVASSHASTQNIRLGMIGCGGRGKFLIKLFQEHGGYNIAGAADFFADRATEAATIAGLETAQTFTGIDCAEKMIAAGRLDAVAVISPPYFHPTQIAAAVEAGLHVYLAKPAAVDVPGCWSIRASGEKARKRNLASLVDFQTRANEYYVEAVRRMHSGEYGDLVFGEAAYHAGRLNAKAEPGTPGARLRNWVFDIPLSGDIIVEQNIHSLDVMSWVMNDTPPLECTGTGGRQVRVDVGDCWDNFQLVYQYDNDVGITFSSRQYDSFGEPGGITNRFFATGGVFSSKYGGDVRIRSDAERFYRGGNTGSIYRDGAASNIETFHQTVAAGDFTNPTLEPSIMSNLVAVMGRMAAYSGKSVSWEEVINSNERMDADLKEI